MYYGSSADLQFPPGLMEDESFNPLNWARKPATPAAGDTAAGSGGATLPQAWREIGGDTPPAPSVAKPARQSVYAMVIACVLLFAGALGAWLTRQSPPLPEAEAGFADPAPVAPKAGAIERSLNLAGAHEIASALAAAGVTQTEADAAAQTAASVLVAPGDIRAHMVLVPAGKVILLERLEASYRDGSGAVISRTADGAFASYAIAAELTERVKVLRGELDSESFYSSAVAAGLLDTLIPEFINAFAYDFNLASEIAPGDTFEVAFEQAVNAEGEGVGQPRLLFASLTTPQKSLSLYRFMPAGQEAGWFDGNGASTKRGLMRTPVDGARITSKFGMRFHPVLHYNRLHGGVDFAAPTGTPIYAAADGTVDFAAMKGANGNLTILRHENGLETYYLHQSAFMPGIQPGARIFQGQHIGDVGTTGRSTGPHLHYEVHINGERVDPLSIKTDDVKRKRLDGGGMKAFLNERDRVDVARAQQSF
ncbi:MAG: M23 family metallopeptidase [Caenibius sp.]